MWVLRISEGSSYLFGKLHKKFYIIQVDIQYIVRSCVFDGTPCLIPMITTDLPFSYTVPLKSLLHCKQNYVSFKETSLPSYPVRPGSLLVHFSGSPTKLMTVQ